MSKSTYVTDFITPEFRNSRLFYYTTGGSKWQSRSEWMYIRIRNLGRFYSSMEYAGEHSIGVF